MPMKQLERPSWAYIKRSTEGRFQANLKIEMEDMQMSQSTEPHFTSFPTVFALGVPRHHPTASSVACPVLFTPEVRVLSLGGHQRHLVLMRPKVAQSQWAYSRVGWCHLSPGTHTHTHTHTHTLRQASDSFKMGVWVKISRGEIASDDRKQVQRASGFLTEILRSQASEKSLYCMHQQTAEWVRTLWRELPGFREIPEIDCLCLPLSALAKGIRGGQCLRVHSQHGSLSVFGEKMWPPSS